MELRPVAGALANEKRKLQKQNLGDRLHHLWLLAKFWLAETDDRQLVRLADGRTGRVVDTPRFGRQRWRIKVADELETVHSDQIERLWGSLSDTGK